jgi:hypothetical protein
MGEIRSFATNCISGKYVQEIEFVNLRAPGLSDRGDDSKPASKNSTKLQPGVSKLHPVLGALSFFRAKAQDAWLLG